jgi:hypothetical protein
MQIAPAAASAAPKPVLVDIKNASGQSVGTANQVGYPFIATGRALNSHSSGGEMRAAQERRQETFRIFRWSLQPMGTAHVTVVAPNVTLGTDDHSVFSNGALYAIGVWGQGAL